MRFLVSGGFEKYHFCANFAGSAHRLHKRVGGFHGDVAGGFFFGSIVVRDQDHRHAGQPIDSGRVFALERGRELDRNNGWTLIQQIAPEAKRKLQASGHHRKKRDVAASDHLFIGESCSATPLRPAPRAGQLARADDTAGRFRFRA